MTVWSAQYSTTLAVYGKLEIWQIGNTNSLEKIKEVQRKVLALYLDLPSQSSLEALEVVSSTLPVDLKREEMARSIHIRIPSQLKES